MPAFYKLLLVSVISLLFACNNSSTHTKDSDPGKKSAALPADSMSKEALFSFVDGCITNANAKLTLGEEKAFAFCKCMYEQLRKDNPEIDSARLDALVNDTAQITKMAASCR